MKTLSAVFCWFSLVVLPSLWLVAVLTQDWRRRKFEDLSRRLDVEEAEREDRAQELRRLVVRKGGWQ